MLKNGTNSRLKYSMLETECKSTSQCQITFFLGVHPKFENKKVLSAI